MLSIAQVSGSGFKYYSSLLEYYAGDEVPSQWFGQGAKKLGLEGPVGEKEFTNLLRGFSPDGSRPLVQNAGHKDRQPGYDLTFTAPKQLSSLWAIADRQWQHAITKTMSGATEDVLKVVESDLCFTRRGHGGKTREHVEVVFSHWFHATSRAKEPNIHSHAILKNFGIRQDGTTGAILTKMIFEQKLHLGLLFREKLAERLEHELGLHVQRTKDGFAIPGVPKELCDAFSSRRKQIKAALEERGLTGAVAAKVACLDTRAKKQHVAPEVLFERWAATARSFGFDREAADRLFGQGRNQEPRGVEQTRSESVTPSTAAEPLVAIRRSPAPASAPPLPEPRIESLSLPPRPARLEPTLTIASAAATPLKDIPKTHTTPTGVASPGKAPYTDLWFLKPVLETNDSQYVLRPAANQSAVRIRTTQPHEKTVAPDRGTPLFRIPFSEFEIRVVRERLFRHAPSWSPVKNFTLPKIVLSHAGERLDIKPRRFSLPLWQKDFGPLRLSTHRNALFPWAPAWSPAARIELRILALNFTSKAHRKSDASLRPDLSTLSKLREQFSAAKIDSPKQTRPYERTL